MKKMAAKNKILCSVVVALLALGFYDVFVNVEDNGCSMTYMFEYPSYIVSIRRLFYSDLIQIHPYRTHHSTNGTHSVDAFLIQYNNSKSMACKINKKSHSICIILNKF